MAARRGETTLEELAAEVGVDASTIKDDLQEVAERSEYLPADAGADLQIILDGDRVYVWTKGEFSRPLRLSIREALAVALGLRLGALSPTIRDHEARDALRRRLEAHLAGAPSDELLEAFEAPDLGPDPQAVRETLSTAAREHRPCVIRHLKPGQEPEDRRIHPYALVHAEGSWYTLAHCEKAGTIRRFRVDRTLAARLDEGAFHERPDFNPEEHVGDGRAFDTDSELEAVVRYSSPVARLVAESEEGDWAEDGTFVVRHRIADPGWLVRRVLEFGGAAEVVSPEGLRTAVREAAEAFLGNDRRTPAQPE